MLSFEEERIADEIVRKVQHLPGEMQAKVLHAAMVKLWGDELQSPAIVSYARVSHPGQLRGPNHTPTLDEALADPAGFVEGMKEE